MSIGYELDQRMNLVTNNSLTSEERLTALSFILDYICNTSHPNNYVIATVTQLLDAIESDDSSDISIRYLVDELRHVLALPQNPKYSVVISVKNQLFDFIADLHSTDWFIVPLSDVCLTHVDSYDFFIKTDENDFPKSLCSNRNSDVFIDLYQVCYYEFLCYPMTYDVYLRYKSSVISADTLVTGMSYFRNALLPEYLPGNVCNISNSSQDLYYDFLCFKDAMKQNPNIQNLVIGLAPYSLRYDLSLTQNESERMRLFYYYSKFQDYHNNRDLVTALNDYYQHYKKATALLGIDSIDSLFEKIVENDVIDTERKSYLCFDPASLIPAEIAQMSAKFKKPYPKTLEENKRILREYIEYATKHNVKTKLYIPPYSSWYKEYWDTSYLDELLAFLNDLKRDYNITIIDLSSLNLPNECFGDYAHLNRLGAIRVAGILSEYLQ